MNKLYLLIDFFTILVPAIFSFHPKLRFDKQVIPFAKGCLIAASVFILWDIYFTKIGVWGFNPRFLIGIYFYNLPIEEILFFICIPYSSIFTYYCMKQYRQFLWSNKTIKYIVTTLVILLYTIGFINYTKAYTASTCISLATVLFLHLRYKKTDYLAGLIITYIIILLPFFIVNGILTGTGIPEPVVWYNNDENIGIRLLTIPIEDVFYGFELILLNAFFFEFYKKKNRHLV